jgi:hydrogenase maturation protein HypF
MWDDVACGKPALKLLLGLCAITSCSERLRDLLPPMKEPPTTGSVRRRIRVRGIVQGVGFRPFVYNLAQGLGLAGYVLNSSAGVTIEIEGHEPAAKQFVATLRTSPPPLAQIADVAITELEPVGETGFVIRQSEAEPGEFVLVSPDVATCDDCWRDFGDAANRRYGYPFTNCTNCGPRYTIIQDIPYDRPATTMAKFRMCPLCQAEYDDPSNRRFHAQPNACPECGPGVALVPSDRGFPREEDYRSRGTSSILRQVRELLRQGKIVAVKGLGGFLLACDAQNDEAVRTLRTRKRRSDKPFALMARDIADVEAFCKLKPEERNLLLSAKRPIVILQRREGSAISPAVAPGNNTIGVMLPYTPLHYLLFSDSPGEASQFRALVMTSGNLSEEPIVTSDQEAWQRLREVADWFVFHNRDIYMRADDSVARVFEQQERVLRRSRGYVPHPVDLGIELKEILACGAELKNTLCLTKGRYAILSQHIGDLENYETLLFFEETLANLKKLFRVEPRAVAYDLHPQYMSTQFAQRLPLEPKVGVQHHHAHIASCMAENHLSGKVIGAAFDGTGYGTDGKIWGGEFLVADFAGFERRAHLRYVSLPGGDTAVRQPWRMALSYLRDALGAEADRLDLAPVRETPKQHVAVVDAMLAKRLNCVDTSSCGRLFDAVSSIVGVRHEVTFEGQAAIELEMIADSSIERAYPYTIAEGDIAQLDMRPMIEAMVRELLRGITASEIAAAFHNTLAAAIVEVCRRIRQAENLSRVCLSGGTFQNMFLLRRAAAALHGSGFEVFLHSKVPPNDGGIALGQAVIANAILEQFQGYCSPAG